MFSEIQSIPLRAQCIQKSLPLKMKFRPACCTLPEGSEYKPRAENLPKEVEHNIEQENHEFFK